MVAIYEYLSGAKPTFEVFIRLFEEVSKTIEIINSRVYLCKALVRGLCTDATLNL